VIDLADASQVDERRRALRVLDLDQVELAPVHELIVAAREADGAPAVLADQPHDLLIDRAAEHHLHDVHRLLIGDAQAAAEGRANTDALEHAIDLRPPAVHDHDADADVAQQADVSGEALLQLLVHHGVPAVLHDERTLVEALNVGQGFVQNLGLADEVVHRERRVVPGGVPC
jgi:hypothetical protein